ncbi:hypothetical protein [Curvibacter fontanus]|jgi:hypothetical protein
MTLPAASMTALRAMTTTVMRRSRVIDLARQGDHFVIRLHQKGEP